MNNASHKKYLRSDARKLSSSDYEVIMQYSNEKSKPVTQLAKQYGVSNSRLYKIWRGEETPYVNKSFTDETKSTKKKKSKCSLHKSISR